MGGGGSADFIFMGARIFLIYTFPKKKKTLVLVKFRPCFPTFRKRGLFLGKFERGCSRKGVLAIVEQSSN